MPKLAAFILLLFSPLFLKAQAWEIGAFGGGSGYTGDLNPNNPLKISGIAAGAFVKYNFDGYLCAKLNYTYGSISGADSTSSSVQMRQRNLSFMTQLNELSVIGEFNFMRYIPEAGQNKFTPFIYLGVGILGYNPQAVYQGQTYDLRPLMTEGQSRPYAKTAFAIPYGAGVKFNFAGKWNLTGDLGYRQPNTNYLDDVAGAYPDKSKLASIIAQALSDRSGEHTGVYSGSPGSQRGDQRNRDSYLFITIGISFTFVTQKCYF
jgi:hypothetical protein